MYYFEQHLCLFSIHSMLKQFNAIGMEHDESSEADPDAHSREWRRILDVCCTCHYLCHCLLFYLSFQW